MVPLTKVGIRRGNNICDKIADESALHHHHTHSRDLIGIMGSNIKNVSGPGTFKLASSFLKAKMVLIDQALEKTKGHFPCCHVAPSIRDVRRVTLRSEGTFAQGSG